MHKETVMLYENTPPLHIEGEEIPLLHYYATEHKRGDGAVLIFAGGGYAWRAPHESEGYAEFINSIGLDAFVLDYRVAPHRFPVGLLDAREAIRYIRKNAKKIDINPEKIAVMGSSAGGHLAALVSSYREKIHECESEVDYLPNAQILCYPVTDIESHRGSYENLLGENISRDGEVNPRLLADKKTPSSFIWHTSSDPSVSVRGSYRYADRLAELGVDVEMHIYPVGGHGLGLANGGWGRECLPYLQRWSEELERWLKIKGFISG